MEHIRKWVFFLSLYLVLRRLNAEKEEVRTSLVSFLGQLSSVDAQKGPILDWNINSDPCINGWQGVTCNNQTNSVYKIVLDGLNLSGTLNASLLCQAELADSLTVLNLNNNSVHGEIPEEIGNCNQLTHLDVSNNRFTGVLPGSISQITNMIRLDIAYNNFSGELPELSKLSRLLSFLAEYNQIDGEIPKLDFSNLQLFNISFNNFSGSVPDLKGRFHDDSLLGNPGLCGQPTTNPCPGSPRKRKVHLKEQILMFSGYIFIGLVVVVFILFKFISQNKSKEEKLVVVKSKEVREDSSTSISSKKTSNASIEYYKTGVSKSEISMASGESTMVSASLVVLTSPVVKGLRFEDLLKAPAELLGRGKYGSLYKVIFGDVAPLVVKRIKDWSISSEDFKRRMQKIDKVKHPHMLPVSGFYSSKQEKLIVYEYQQNGSLNMLLQETQTGKPFEWSSRLSVAARIAEALEFMHKELLQDRIAHGNLKSSNILFNRNMEPCISEYGLMVVENQNHSSFSHFIDQARDRTYSTFKVDIYGFGVLLLELLTGKLNDCNGFDLATWVQTAIKEEWTVEVFDKALLREGASEERMVNLLQVALKCVDPSPETRPSMNRVTAVINAIKEEEEMSMAVSEAA